MMNIYERIQQFQQLVKEVPQEGTASCIDSRKRLGDNIQVTKRLGGASVYGEAYKGEMTRPDGKIVKVAIKKIPLTYGAIHHMATQQVPQPNHTITSSVWAELACLHLTTELVLQRIVPNLPCMYTYTICNHCSYKNDKINNRMFGDPNYQESHACILAVSELATAGDFESWCTSRSHSLMEWNVAYFQIFSALYCLQLYYGLVHHDLHWGNIIVSKIANVKPHSFIKYRISNRDYYVPDHGWRFIIWDFGMASVSDKYRKKINITKFEGVYQQAKHLYPESYDAQQISRAPYWMLQLKDEGKLFVPNAPEAMYTFADTCTHFFKQRKPLERQIARHWGDVFATLPKKGIVRETYHIGKPMKSLNESYRWFLTDPSLLNTDYSRYETGVFENAGSDALLKNEKEVDNAVHIMEKHGSHSLKNRWLFRRAE